MARALIELSLVILLAQTCVAEIDLQESPDECVVMWGINWDTAERRGLPLAAQTLEFNAYWKVTHTSRAWIGALDASGEPPVGWPTSRSWRRELPRWRAYLAAAVEFASAPGSAPTCRYAGKPRRLRADTYGGTPGDGVHADDPQPCAQARRVYCLRGERQAYWNTAACRVARRRGGRAIPASVAAGRPNRRKKPLK